MEKLEKRNEASDAVDEANEDRVYFMPWKPTDDLADNLRQMTAHESEAALRVYLAEHYGRMRNDAVSRS